ncbi:Polyketide cyclase / dehydrase and lipid transport [Enhygromyxa salina]|uniref:Polyketide cyclase / dehydrase and lipid transport n=1 Tax=Enhygromyxa salina TaxID=215803 RepID=A0A2S9XJP0_9BACT|nr:SRPBCC family protein [Enhygromyxa salina]PRP93099.1 Polyketide cyclase / dehydrase and lipid transport [Enhygromyxa salina]
MAKKIALGALALVALFVVVVLILAATKADQIHVERSLVMRGTPADVFPHANDFTKFVEWMPWAELDPEQKTEFSDPPAGVGAWYTWVGNEQVGQGRMEILSAEPDKIVVHKLEFIEPWPGVAESSISMKAVGEDQVEVTWAFSQDAALSAKVMMVFIDMDTMLGADFEKGLRKLQPLVEAEPEAG